MVSHKFSHKWTIWELKYVTIKFNVVNIHISTKKDLYLGFTEVLTLMDNWELKYITMKFKIVNIHISTKKNLYLDFTQVLTLMDNLGINT